jgi:hypothetical protein
MLVGTRFAYVDIEAREEMATTLKREEMSKQDHGGGAKNEGAGDSRHRGENSEGRS